MKIDIKARIRNKAFLLSVIAFVVLLIKTFTKIELPNNFDVIVNMALSIMTALGIVIDPSTSGINDNEKIEEVSNEEAK